MRDFERDWDRAIARAVFRCAECGEVAAHVALVLDEPRSGLIAESDFLGPPSEQRDRVSPSRGLGERTEVRKTSGQDEPAGEEDPFSALCELRRHFRREVVLEGHVPRGEHHEVPLDLEPGAASQKSVVASSLSERTGVQAGQAVVDCSDG